MAPTATVGEEELITRVVLTMTSGQGETVSVTAADPDGDATGFRIDTLTVAAGETYAGTVALYDDANGEEITPEVLEEAEEHQLFYTVGGGASGRITVTVDDRDANGLPLGLSYTLAVSAGGASTGSLNLVLSHYDDGPKNGTDRSDETDVDVTFPMVIR